MRAVSPRSGDHCSVQPPGGSKLQVARPTGQSEAGNPSLLTTHHREHITGPAPAPHRPTQTRHPNNGHIIQTHNNSHLIHSKHTRRPTTPSSTNPIHILDHKTPQKTRSPYLSPRQNIHHRHHKKHAPHTHTHSTMTPTPTSNSPTTDTHIPQTPQPCSTPIHTHNT